MTNGDAYKFDRPPVSSEGAVNRGSYLAIFSSLRQSTLGAAQVPAEPNFYDKERAFLSLGWC